MANALIVSGGGKAAGSLAPILREASVDDIYSAASAGEARRLMVSRDFDLCIINAPLPDESGRDFAVSAACKGISGVILIVPSEHFAEISDAVEDYGVLTIPRPVVRTIMWSALKMALAAHKKMRMMEDENRKLIRKIEDIRIIDRAKCVIVSHLSMTEPEAHKFIEKQAMDMRMTRRAVAEAILKTYEN